MKRGYKKSRIHTKKALKIMGEIKEKFPSKIQPSEMSEEDRSLFQIRLMQFRENLRNIYFKNGRPEWWEAIRIMRNKTGHQTEDFNDEQFKGIFDNFISKIPTMEKDLKTNIRQFKQPSRKKRQFETFGSQAIGTEEERKQLVDAIEDQFSPTDPTDITIEFPSNLFSKETEKTVQQILNHGSVGQVVKTHSGLSENIQTDILQWIQDVNKKLESENPFFEEELFIEKQKTLSADELAADLSGAKSKIRWHYSRLPSVSPSKRGNIRESTLDFDFYQKQFRTLKENDDKKDLTVRTASEQAEILRRNFIADMEKNLIERKTRWEQEKIDEFRKQFLEELYEKTEPFQHQYMCYRFLCPRNKSLSLLYRTAAKNGISIV